MNVYPPEEIVVPSWEGGGMRMPQVTLGKFNSQVAEQCNAKLDQIATQVAYMSQSNFMAVVKYYLLRLNQRMLEGYNITP